MDPLTLMLILGAVGYLMAKDGQETAAKDGREITLTKGLAENAVKVAQPVVAKARERATSKREAGAAAQAQAQGFKPFGKPADKMPPFSAKNPSGFEQFLVAQPSLLKRLLKMFGHEPTTKVYRGPASGSAGESSGSDGATANEARVNAHGLTPEQEWTTRDRISERLTKEAPEAGVAPAAWLQRIKDEEYARARAEFNPEPPPASPRIVPGVVVEPSTSTATSDPTPEDTPQERKPMADTPKYTSQEELGEAWAKASTEAMDRLRIMQERGAPEDVIEAERQRFIQEWTKHKHDLEEWIRAGRPGDATDASTPEAPMPSGGGTSSAAPDSGQADPSASTFNATPLRYMEALHSFATSTMTATSIPSLIGSLHQCGEAFTQQGQMLHQVAQRLDEEALLDQRVVEDVRSAAEAALRAGSRFTQSAQIAQAYYRRWVDAVANGARVPSQAVLTATASS